MAGPERRPPRRTLWQRLKRLLGIGPPPPDPPLPPDDEPSLVPVGPPSAPRGGAAMLDQPREPEDVDARGREE